MGLGDPEGLSSSEMLCGPESPVFLSVFVEEDVRAHGLAAWNPEPWRSRRKARCGSPEHLAGEEKRKWRPAGGRRLQPLCRVDLGDAHRGFKRSFHFSYANHRGNLHSPQTPPSHCKFSFTPGGFSPLASPPSQHPFFSPRS